MGVLGESSVGRRQSRSLLPAEHPKYLIPPFSPPSFFLFSFYTLAQPHALVLVWGVSPAASLGGPRGVWGRHSGAD